MGQLVELHDRTLELLEVIREAAAAAAPAEELRVYDSPPTSKPGDMPCIFALTPAETFQRLDTMTGESNVTTTLRLCLDLGDTQLHLLQLTELIVAAIDVWLWNDPPPPIDRAKRRGFQPVTPEFDGTPCRGMDFAIETQLLALIHPPSP